MTAQGFDMIGMERGEREDGEPFYLPAGLLHSFLSRP
jgi:hypothetical protein